MFHWLRDHHRAEARKRQFPSEWEAFLRANVSHYCVLNEAERAELCAMIQVFVEEKHWEGCGGLDLTDRDSRHHCGTGLSAATGPAP